MTLTGDDTQIVTRSIKKKRIYIGFGFNLEKISLCRLPCGNLPNNRHLRLNLTKEISHANL